ncbi:hypothetical protein FB451DRAFT_1563201 [Mycena latifolia]|nr:hypothetical protein FB451DRAFT_1563201 [Mycena latifolia]
MSLRSIRDLRSVSVVNRRLRQLCLPLIFRITRCTSWERFQQLAAKCTANPGFARLIRRLDLFEVHTRDVLFGLLPCLTSLTWLHVDANQVNARLLTAVNSHLTLATAAVYNLHLIPLRQLLRSTNQPFSKILICKTTIDRCLTLGSEALRAVVERGAKFAHLVLQASDKVNFEHGGGGLLPGLDQLDLRMYGPSMSVETWLPLFVRRHRNLSIIKFFDPPSFFWSDNRDVPFAFQFIRAISGASYVDARPKSFSITYIVSWTSLDDWEVVQLELMIPSPSGMSALRAASILAPRLSSLDLTMHGIYATTPIHIYDFAEPFSHLTALRTLHVTNAYRHLHFGGQSPWLSSQRVRDALGTSVSVIAHNAMRWYMTRVAHQATSLELIHITDAGHDGKGRFSHPWTLRASFRVRNNGIRDLEVVGR